MRIRGYILNTAFYYFIGGNKMCSSKEYIFKVLLKVELRPQNHNPGFRLKKSKKDHRFNRRGKSN